MRLLLISFILFCGSGSLNPAEYFGESFSEAVTFYKTNHSYYQQFFRSFGVDPKLAAAVVFPETIRYSRFRDFFETTALELAYVNGGKEASDFSIGRFQMKPSFVEGLEQAVAGDTIRYAQFAEIVAYDDCTTERATRKTRVARLQQFRWQVLYLACFVTIATNRFSDQIKANRCETLRILSSAYNLGLNARYADLLRVSQVKSFPYGNPLNGRFSYYDVANYFYQYYTL